MAQESDKQPAVQAVVVQPADEFDLDSFPIEAANTTSAVPARHPELRRDLVVTERDRETVLVRAPDKATDFPIYRMEWQAAELMDGKRTIVEIANQLARAGVSATPDSVKSLARELQGYGFLVEPFDASRVALAPSQDPAAKPDVSAEEIQLLQTAVQMRARGNLDGAESYLLAVLEINPRNDGVRQMIDDLHAAVAAQADGRAAPTGGEAPLAEAPAQSPRAAVQTDRPAPAGLPARLLYVSLAVTVGVVVALAVVLVTMGRDLADRLDGVLGSQRSVSRPPATDTQPGGLPGPNESYVHAVMEPWATLPLAAPMPGVVVEILVTDDRSVAAGEALARLVDIREYQRLALAQRDVARLSKDRRSKFVTSLRKAEQRLQLIERDVSRTTLAAPSSGVVRVSTRVGETVDKGATLFQIEDTSKLTALVRPATLPFPWSQTACRLSHSSIQAPCRVELDGEEIPAGAMRIVVDNSTAQLPEHRAAEIVLFCSSCDG